MESMVIEVVLLGAIEDDQVPIFAACTHRRFAERVDEPCARHHPALAANVAPRVLKGKSIGLNLEKVRLQLLELLLANRLTSSTQVNFGALVPENVRDELLDRSVLDVLTDLKDAVDNCTQFDMFEHFVHKFYSFDDHVSTTVALPVYLLELLEAKHHSDDNEPDLLLVVQDLLRVILNQFEQNFQHSLKESHILALLHDEEAELDAMEEFVL